MGKEQEDITGVKYGSLKALKWSKTIKVVTASGREIYRNFWEFECDCGKIKILRKSSVVGKERSCGCKRNESKKKGYKDIGGTYWSSLKTSAIIRKIPFEVDIQYAWKLFEEQKGLCSLSGEPICFKRAGKGWANGATASLDRRDPKHGYIQGNLQWLHKDVNVMKFDYSDSEYLEWCKKVVEHHRIQKGD